MTVKADIAGVPAGNGIYGQKNRSVRFHVGDSMVSKVDMNTHQMRVFRNGKLMRTIPITTGEQPKFTTRSGIKVIVEKFRHKRMNSETVGIDPDSADGYDLDDVEYAMRVTYSGEFVHAAPWSVGSAGQRQRQPRLHRHEHRERRVALQHSPRSATSSSTPAPASRIDLTNGFGDWNATFADYRRRFEPSWLTLIPLAPRGRAARAPSVRSGRRRCPGRCRRAGRRWPPR